MASDKVKCAILDACFSPMKQQGRGMSAMYLKWELDRHGVPESRLDDADIILITCQSTEAAGYIKTIRAKYQEKIIIAGGAASTSPYSLGLYADIVCVGDGQHFFDVLFSRGLDEAKKLPNAWVHGEERRVEIDQGFPFGMSPIQAEDGAYRIWCGRGCKNKCKFCQTGWAYEYKEHPDGNAVASQARQLKREGKKIAYLSNDVAQHSFYKQLPPVEHGSYSVRFLKQHGLPPARQIRIGVEGVSERIRRSVAKPISYSDLLGCTKWLNENKKSVRWFMIAGLPGETSEDWMELQNIIQQWKAETRKGVLAISFTAFCPDPATPFATEALNDDYWENFTAFREWFFGRPGWSNRVKIMSPQQPKSRMEKAVLSLGLTESQIREGGHVSPNSRLVYPYAKQLEADGGGLNGSRKTIGCI